MTDEKTPTSGRYSRNTLAPVESQLDEIVRILNSLAGDVSEIIAGQKEQGIRIKVIEDRHTLKSNRRHNLISAVAGAVVAGVVAVVIAVL